MSEILGAPNGGQRQPDFPQYYVGYGPANQDVVVPSFIAAYTGKNMNSSALNAFPQIPILNWKLSYDGLSRIEGQNWALTCGDRHNHRLTDSTRYT